jgi:hypothetical protein
MRVRNGANTINQIVAVGRNLTALLKQNRRELASPGIQEAKNSRSQRIQEAVFLPSCAGGALLATPRSCKQLPSSENLTSALACEVFELG